MTLVLTVWQKKPSGHPTRAGEGLLQDPSEELFGATVERLLGTVDASCQPFQIVARVGDSSRALQMEPGWTGERASAELWSRYRGLADVNG